VNTRLSFWQAIVVGITIGQQVWRVEHPDMTTANGDTRGDVQSGDGVSRFIIDAIAIGILKK
jgi:hypothetical protein